MSDEFMWLVVANLGSSQAGIRYQAWVDLSREFELAILFRHLYQLSQDSS
jgi:hypothetical protein